MQRARPLRLILPLLVGLLGLSGLLGLAGCTPSGSEPGLLVSHTVDLQPPPPPPPPQATLVLAGDVMLARTPGQGIAQGMDPFSGFASVLQGADLAVGNLECVVATGGQPVPKAYNFRCDPQVVAPLARYFGAVTVANNHSGDYGKAAFAEELGLLQAGGVRYFGGGMNAAEAHTPLLVKEGGLTLAFLGYDEVELRSYEAGPDTPGLAWSDDKQVMADIAVARAEADVVIVYTHWGVEYHSAPSDRQRQLAHEMIDAGADLVVGSHPHVTEAPEYYKNRLILYSLGNFVFDDFKDVSPALNEPSRTSWLLKVELDKQGVVKWTALTARTDDQGFPQPVHGATAPCGSRESPEIGQCRQD